MELGDGSRGTGCGVKILGGGPGEAACAVPGGGPCSGAIELNPGRGGPCMGSGLLFVGGAWLPPAMGKKLCLPKPKGSVIGWVGGVAGVIAAAATCLWGLFLLKALGPLEEGGGPLAPGGAARGGGCIFYTHRSPKCLYLLEISL